jgi:4-amino-4-deoxy-L-arabinose transferase-like glycosyltransferase
MSDLHKSKPFLWTLFLLFCAVWFYTLGARTLVPTDEGRYAEMAREMVVTGDWITPRLNGIKYFEKPPLQVWVTAAAFEVFGLGEWQARLWTGLCGLLGVLLVFHAGRRVFSEKVGFTAALVLGSSFWWAGLGHINSLDMGLSGMMTLALCGVLLGQNPAASAKERKVWMLLCWAGMGLALMSKGLIGLLIPGAVLVLYTLIARDWAIWQRLHMLPGLLVFFAIVTPWHVAVSLRNPEFAHFYFIHEQFQRFTSKIHHREGPLYYFVPLLIAGILPWLTVLVQSVWAGPRSDPAKAFRPITLLTIWAVFIFCFFSISSSKLPGYSLPIFPALALLIALHLQNVGARTWLVAGGFTGFLGVVGLATLSKLPSLTHDPLDLPFYQAALPNAVIGAFILALSGGLVLWWVWKKRSDLGERAVLALAIGGFLAGQFAMQATEPYGHYRSGLPLVPAIQQELTPGAKLYAVGMYDQTLPFYLERTMTLVEHADELEFGLGQEPQLWHPTLDGFIAEWINGKKAVGICAIDTYAELQKRGVPMRVVARDAKRIIIANDIK